MEYGPETYGERVADVYDTWYKYLDPTAEAAFLAELAGAGPALELGIGTGRIALPLAAKGVEVHGIDTSPAIVAKLREKPGGDAIKVTIGNMAALPGDERYPLIFVGFNTFFLLTTQEEQVQCMRSVAAHLAPGGCFVLHAFVPDMSRVEKGSDISVREASLDVVRLDATVYDAAAQRLDSTQIRMTENGIRFVHARLRYAPPTELDLMAQLAGLTLEARYATWDKQPFNAESAFALSVYRA